MLNFVGYCDLASFQKSIQKMNNYDQEILELWSCCLVLELKSNKFHLLLLTVNKNAKSLLAFYFELWTAKFHWFHDLTKFSNFICSSSFNTLFICYNLKGFLQIHFWRSNQAKYLCLGKPLSIENCNIFIFSHNLCPQN